MTPPVTAHPLAMIAMAACLAATASQAVAASDRAPSSGADPMTIKCAGAPRGTCHPASQVPGDWQMPDYAADPEPQPTETLAEDLDAAYHTAPSLQAQRYQLRAVDENYALALSELRPDTTLQVSGNYTKTVPGRTTQATRYFAPSPIITSNSMAATVFSR